MVLDLRLIKGWVVVMTTFLFLRRCGLDPQSAEKGDTESAELDSVSARRCF